MGGFPHVFRNPLARIPNLNTYPLGPGAREPISFAIPFVLLRKKSNDAPKGKMSILSKKDGVNLCYVGKFVMWEEQEKQYFFKLNFISY
jgi:hypothetical protein